MSKRVPRNFLESVQQAPWDRPEAQAAREKLAREAARKLESILLAHPADPKAHTKVMAILTAFAESVEKMR